ncbi:MAG: hypothetical protein Q9170_004877 [Blastenia crenularia]
MLTSSFLLSSLLPLAIGSPLSPRRSDDYPPYVPPVTFGVIAARSTSPIHLQSVNANGTTFWIGKDTSIYCPLANQTDCPNGTDTIFAVGSDGRAGLDTVVPGGQEIYVAPTGALSFTIAHSGSYPPGSALQTFNATEGGSDGSLGVFTFTGLGATGFIACPATPEGPYQVFADIEGLKDEDVPGGHKDACLGFGALVAPYSGSPAWEYI